MNENFYIDTVRDDKVSDSPVKHIQCINVRHIVAWKNNGDDVHIVRLKVYYEDGKVGTRIELWYNWERNVYITSHSYRKYKQKKAREHLSKLEAYPTTQSNLKQTVMRKLNIRSNYISMNEIAKNTPYLYGTATTSTALIKSEINGKIIDPNFIRKPSSYCAFDIESNVYKGTNDEPRIITIATDDHKATLLLESTYYSWIDLNLLDNLIKEHFPDWDITVKNAGSQSDLSIAGFKQVNDYDKDYCGVWNIGYDLPTIEKALKKDNIDIEEVFHGFDDKLQPYYNYWKGNTVKVTSSGKKRSLAPSEIWNTVVSTSRSEWLDAMVMVRIRRMGFGEIPGGYSLDNVLNHFLKRGKLKIANELDGLGGLDWHYQMQKQFPTEYCIYALFDVIGMVLLEEKTSDITKWLQSTDTPTNLVNKSSANSDDVFYRSNEKDGWINCHIGVDEDLEERESKIYNLKNWIAILPSYLMNARKLTGKYFKPLVNTVWNSISSFVSDADLVSAYPSMLICLNAGLETTVFEWMRKQPNIKLSEMARRKAIMNRPTGLAGQQGIATGILNLPNYNEIDKIVKQRKHEATTLNTNQYHRTQY